jgi:hypothetical protein
LRTLGWKKNIEKWPGKVSKPHPRQKMTAKEKATEARHLQRQVNISKLSLKK